MRRDYQVNCGQRGSVYFWSAREMKTFAHSVPVEVFREGSA